MWGIHVRELHICKVLGSYNDGSKRTAHLYDAESVSLLLGQADFTCFQVGCNVSAHNLCSISARKVYPDSEKSSRHKLSSQKMAIIDEHIKVSTKTKL